LSSSHKVVPLSWDSQIHFLVLPLASVLNFFCVSVCQVEGYLSLENVCLVKSSEVHHQFTAKLIFMDVHVWNHDKLDEITVPLVYLMLQKFTFSQNYATLWFCQTHSQSKHAWSEVYVGYIEL
jgi:protein-tyrosine phosphatase